MSLGAALGGGCQGDFSTRPAEPVLRGGPRSAGRKKSAVIKVQINAIASNSPMLAVPGWGESQRLPNAVDVVSALNTMARLVLDSSMWATPDRHATTK